MAVLQDGGIPSSLSNDTIILSTVSLSGLPGSPSSSFANSLGVSVKLCDSVEASGRIPVREFLCTHSLKVAEVRRTRALLMLMPRPLRSPFGEPSFLSEESLGIAPYSIFLLEWNLGKSVSVFLLERNLGKSASVMDPLLGLATDESDVARPLRSPFGKPSFSFEESLGIAPYSILLLEEFGQIR